MTTILYSENTEVDQEIVITYVIQCSDITLFAQCDLKRKERNLDFAMHWSCYTTVALHICGSPGILLEIERSD